nr:hypothetical protein [Clostridium neonatale]
MSIKEFIDENGTNLIIEHNKTNIVFKTDNKNIKNKYSRCNVMLCFNKNTFKEITKYLEDISKELWTGFNPKEANSLNSDYYEYYDRKYDNNGYLSISTKNTLKIEKPYIDCPYMYKFNKRRMESFIYDLKK